MPDEVEGQPADETPAPGPDRSAAAANPHADRLGRVAVGNASITVGADWTSDHAGGRLAGLYRGRVTASEIFLEAD